MEDILITARNLGKFFGRGADRNQIVRDLDLDVARGSFTLIKGPSGCGKSTLLAMLAGLTAPDAGQVMVSGVDLWALGLRGRDRLRMDQMGFVFQGSVLLPGLSAVDQITFLLREAGQDRRAARANAEQALTQVGLGPRAGLKPAALSGGEKQRVAVAMALAKRPAIIFADEPTSALDTENADAVAGLLRAHASAAGAAVLCVTHDDRLLPYADRVLQMRAGRIEAERMTERQAA